MHTRYEEDPNGMFRSNEDSLLDELHLATTGSSATGMLYSLYMYVLVDAQKVVLYAK